MHVYLLSEWISTKQNIIKISQGWKKVVISELWKLVGLRLQSKKSTMHEVIKKKCKSFHRRPKITRDSNPFNKNFYFGDPY